MPENPNQHHHLVLYNQQQQQQPPHRPVTTQSRMRSTGGEIVEVQGGHIVRSTGRKDRHSKVCTAKGPRDRRVRLSAHTAIQFYDVQDRLGYDRPSKAVDWLMKNAKAAIDELAELPAWNPTATTNAAAAAAAGGVVAGPNLNQLDSHVHGESSNKQINIVDEPGSSSGYGFGGGGGGGTSFLPPSLDSDSIADTIKSFFPMGAGGGAAPSSAAASENSPIGFQNYPPDLLSRSSSSQNQDLRLSLQSFQDPIFHHPNAAAAATHHQHLQNHPNAHGQQTLFPGFDAAAGLVPWNVGESSSGGGGGGGGGGGNVGGGYVFNVPFQQQAVAMHQMIGHQGQFFTQRGPLQSSNPPFARAWVDPMAAASSAADYPTMQHSVIHPSFQSFGFASGSSGFSGFRIPARIQGEEEHDGLSDKPSSASSGSRH